MIKCPECSAKIKKISFADLELESETNGRITLELWCPQCKELIGTYKIEPEDWG